MFYIVGSAEYVGTDSAASRALTAMGGENAIYAFVLNLYTMQHVTLHRWILNVKRLLSDAGTGVLVPLA